VILENGQNTNFWYDRWLGECTLMSQFYQLYALCTDPLISVYEVILSEGHDFIFTRALTWILLINNLMNYALL
jgi:hypothetical protein